MVIEENVERKMVYKWEKCGWIYEEESLAEKCEAWCEKHKSCNLEITKHSIKIWRKINDKNKIKN